MRETTDDYLALAAKLREGGGKARVKKMHEQGKLAPRERVAALLDPGAPWLEVGLLVAHDRYDGQAPGAGVITGVGMVSGREAVVVANDATV
ncbi:MAG TPA: carboxyl transferase domain-containing protein, partial [Gemmatimonadales bacterium]|nr:carboxyl transferase domain-containing protein [Gemmatimonadales bacterium]